MMRKRIALLALLIFPACGSAQTKPVWQIGIFDRSSLEFRKSAREQVTFRVGQSDWKEDWPAEQLPGRPYSIEFTLDSTPQGIFTLKVSALTYHPRIPALQVEVNGHKGVFYFQPKLSYYLGDQMSVFDPQYSEAALEMQLPTGYLSPGKNTMVLTCIDEPPSPESDVVRRHPLSGIHYDAVSLSSGAAGQSDAGAVSARVAPTIFYRQRSKGLVEVVEAVARFSGKIPTGRAVLKVAGQEYARSFAGGNDFGEQRVEFELLEWKGAAKANLEIAGKSFDVTLTPERKWTVFVVPHEHLDVGYTDFQGKVAEAQARVLGQVPDMIRRHPDFRFAIDGSWSLEQFLDTRSKAKQDELLNLIRTNKVDLTAVYASLLTGAASLETLYRSLYYSKELSRRYGLPFNFANITDIPTVTGAYPSILAASGIKYFAIGGEDHRAPVQLYERWNEKSPYWWEGPDGKKVMVWYSRCYSQVMYTFGLPPDLAAGRESLPVFLQAYSRPEYKPDAVLLYGTQAENTDLFPTTATFATDWNTQYAFPKLQYATFTDFFRYIDERYGKSLPTYKGDQGPYWEDGIASNAYYSAEDRMNQGRALSAEVLSSVTHDIDPNMHAPESQLAGIWRNILLYAEHTWGPGTTGSQPDHVKAVKQLEVKDNRALLARLAVDDLVNRSMGQLADQIHIPAETLVVFNSLSWQRDALVETDVRDRVTIEDLATGQAVPYEVVWRKQGFQHVRFVARDVPAVGYKCFALGRDAPAQTEPELKQNPEIENAYYHVKVHPQSGAIASIYDKQLGRELVDQSSPYKFGQYLYVVGGEGTVITRVLKGMPPGELTEHPATGGEFLGAAKTPWGYSIRLRSHSVNTPAVETEVLLYDGRKKIEFCMHVKKDSTMQKEAAYFAFPVALSSPGFAYATQMGWVDPAHDILKGGCLEWFSIQHWMAARDSRTSVAIVPVDAPVASFGDIFRGHWVGEFRPKSSTMFSFIMTNYRDSNYHGRQGGDFEFRYVMTSDGHLDPPALTRLGLESMRPRELNHVLRQDKVGNPARPLPAEGASFLDVSAGDVVLVTWKKAEDGNGAILRLQETAGRTAEATVGFPRMAIRSAKLCNAMEDDLRDLATNGKNVKLSFKPYEVLTVRVAQ